MYLFYELWVRPLACFDLSMSNVCGLLDLSEERSKLKNAGVPDPEPDDMAAIATSTDDAGDENDATSSSAVSGRYCCCCCCCCRGFCL